MSLNTRYAVPFNNRKAVTDNNVINNIIKGGIGYLKVELPVNPLINNSIGFKIVVTSMDSSDLLFEGHISGSSSDNFNWIYGSCTELTCSLPKFYSTLFCYKYIDKDSGNKYGNVVRSVLIGNSNTNWGESIKVSIEVLQVTDKVTPDNESGSISTNSFSEYRSLSGYIDESNHDLGKNDGWNFIIGDIDDEIVSLEYKSPVKSDDSSIIINGVVEGISETDESGNKLIFTRFTDNRLDLYDDSTKSYGEIIADGSKLVGLKNNEDIKNLALVSIGFDKPITISSSLDSDVSLNLIIQNSGEVHNPKLEINKIDLGEWSETNSRYLTIKTTTKTGENSPVSSLNLKSGELGAVLSGNNTDLFLGTGLKNKLIGAAKICNTKLEFDSLDIIEGRLVIYEEKLYVGTSDGYSKVNLSASLSLDEIKNGYFYEKVNADAQLGGEIVRLKHDSGLLLSNDIYNHIINEEIHVSQVDRDYWNNKVDLDQVYTKKEIDNIISEVDKNEIIPTSYHNPVNDVVPGGTDLSSHNYPYGHRVLVRESSGSLPHILTAGNTNEWILDEPFNIGDRVIASYGQYIEYINMDNKVIDYMYYRMKLYCS